MCNITTVIHEAIRTESKRVSGHIKAFYMEYSPKTAHEAIHETMVKNKQWFTQHSEYREYITKAWLTAVTDCIKEHSGDDHKRLVQLYESRSRILSSQKHYLEYHLSVERSKVETLSRELKALLNGNSDLINSELVKELRTNIAELEIKTEHCICDQSKNGIYVKNVNGIITINDNYYLNIDKIKMSDFE